jgi:hypothetical protein
MLQGLKPTEWLIKDVIPASSLVFLHAPPKAGKTFMAIAIAMSIATGISFCGYEVKKQGTCLYLVGEGDTHIMKRFRGWEHYHGIEASALLLSQRRFKLTGTAQDVIDLADDALRGYGFPAINLIVIDTLRRHLDGHENDPRDAEKFADAALCLKEKYQCAVVIIHHSNRAENGRMNGASNHLANADKVYMLEGSVTDVVSLVDTDSKDFGNNKPLNFRYVSVDVPEVLKDVDHPEYGCETTLVPVLTTDTPQPKPKPLKPNGDNPANALTILRQCYQEARDNLKQQGYDASKARVPFDYWLARCKDEYQKDSTLFNGRYLSPSMFSNRIVAPLEQAGFIRCEHGDVLLLC